MKSSSMSTRSSNYNSSSPSSTLSESSNSPIFICTRKPRTQRKRPNQKYNEAAALLSTANPNIFSPKNLKSPPKFCLPHEHDVFIESSELLLPFRVIEESEFLLDHDPVQENEGPSFKKEIKVLPLSEIRCQSPADMEIQSNPMDFFSIYPDDFDAESILDEEIEEGVIDTIMGNTCANAAIAQPNSVGYGYEFGGKIGLGFGNCLAVNNALRNVNGASDWWDFPFPTVDVFEISPRFRKSPLPNSPNKKRKNSQIPAKPKQESEKCSELIEANPSDSGIELKSKVELLLKLNYDGILSEWSDRRSPFSDESIGSDLQGTDVSTRLAQIDLFPEAGGVREAIVQRYKEKRRNRLFSKKIRYQVRKDNADQRPRMKGRFVRQSNSSSSRKKR